MILVTGAAGFIGHHLIPLLKAEGHEIVGLDKNGDGMKDLDIPRIICDITDTNNMKNLADSLRVGKPVTHCIHLAAIASPRIAEKEPGEAWMTNVQGTHNVLELLHQAGCPRVLFFSSAHVYGISPKYMPTDENHPLALHDTYTTTKIVGEQLCKLFYDNHGISYTNLRLWNAYGPGQSPDYFIGKKISQAVAGKDITIWNGSVTKDWVHVSDVVEAAARALVSNYIGPLNVGTGIETSLAEIISQIADAFGSKVVPEDLPDDGPTRMRCDYTRIKRLLDWEPKVKFKDGLADLIEHARKA